MNVGAFRTAFPEFESTTKYPSAQIEFWAGFAEAQVRQQVWGKQWANGVFLYVAHQLVLAAHSKKTAKFGGNPGTFGGIASQKTVGTGTVSYDPATTSEKDAGFWNLTNYGRQFIRLARIYGAKAVQL